MFGTHTHQSCPNLSYGRVRHSECVLLHLLFVWLTLSYQVKGAQFVKFHGLSFLHVWLFFKSQWESSTDRRDNRRLSHARKSMLTRGQKSRQKCWVDNLLGFFRGKCIKGSKISDFAKYIHLHGESSYHLSPSHLSQFVIIDIYRLKLTLFRAEKLLPAIVLNLWWMHMVNR